MENDEVDEIHPLEEQFDRNIQLFDELDRMHATIQATGKIDRQSMEWLQRMCPDAVSPHFPIASYTTTPSQQNIDVSLESFSYGKSLAIAVIIAIIGELIHSLIKVFRGSHVESKVEMVNDIEENGDKKLKELDDEMARVKREIHLSSENLRELDMTEHNEMFRDAPATTNDGKHVLEFMRTGGVALTVVSRWAMKLSDRVHDLNRRLDVIIRAVENIETADASKQNQIAALLKSSRLDEHDQFLEDVAMLNSRLTYLEGRVWSDLIHNDVRGTKDYIKYILSKNNWRRYFSERVIPMDLGGFEKNLEGLDSKAKVFMQVSKNIGSRGSSSVSHREDGTTVVVRSNVVQSIDLHRELKITNDAIRSEVSKLIYFKRVLDRVLDFYRIALIDHNKIAKQMLENIDRIRREHKKTE